MPDALGNLRQIRWRGIAFPIANLRTQIAQRLAPHEMPDVDGERQEGMGRKAIAVSGRALFLNYGTAFDRTGNSDPLYPTVHRAFLEAMADKTTGELVHPELGPMNCKPATADSSLDGGLRDGAVVECSWVETLTDDEVDVLGTTTPLAAIPTAAADLDAEIARLRILQIKNAHKLPAATFADLTRSITRAAGTVGAISHRASRAGSNVIKQLNDVRSALSSARSNTTTAAMRALERLESAVHAASLTQFAGGKKLKAYVVPDADTTLGALARRFGMTVDDIVRLNPRLVGSPRIPRLSLVRYFA
jgi:prophage DNA circulation protein